MCLRPVFPSTKPLIEEVLANSRIISASDDLSFPALPVFKPKNHCIECGQDTVVLAVQERVAVSLQKHVAMRDEH